MPAQFQRIDAPDAAFGTLQAKSMIDGGQQMTQLGDALSKRALVLAEERNKARAYEAETELMNWQIDYLHNPETGAFNKRGNAAFDVTRTTMKTFDTKAKEIMDKMENDDQRARFQARLLDNSSNMFEQVSKFERDELFAYGKSARQGTLQTYKDAAAANAKNPVSAEPYYAQMEQTLAEDGQMAPDEIKAQVNAERSKNILTGIQQAVDSGDNETAYKNYDNFKDVMTGPDKATAEVVAENARMNVETTAKANELVMTATTKADAIRQAKALEAEKGKKWTDTLVTNLNTLYGQKEAVIDTTRNDNIRSAWTAIDAGKGVEVIPAWADPGTRAAMNKAISERSRGVVSTTDPVVLRRLRNQFQSRPGEFATANIAADLPKLSPQDRATVMGWQAEAAAGLSDSQLKANEQKFLSSTSIDKVGQTQFREMFGQNLTKGRKAEEDRYLARLDQEVEAEAERLGKSGLSRDEVKAIAVRLLRDGKVQRDNWFDEDVKEYQVKEGEQSKFYINYDRIPEDARIDARKTIKRINDAATRAKKYGNIIPDTKEGVERVYNATIMRRPLYNGD